MIRRRVETQRAQSRPDYKDDRSSEETERGQEPLPLLRKRKSVLPSLNLSPAPYLLSTIPKSAPAKAPECSTAEFFPENQEELTPMTEKQEAGPIKMASPPPSDSDDSATGEEQEKGLRKRER